MKKVIATLALVVGLPIAAWSVSIKCPKEPAAAWAKSLTATEKTAMLPTAANMITPYRSAFVQSLTSDQKVAFWQKVSANLPYPSTKYPQTPARDAAIAHYRSVLVADNFQITPDGTIQTAEAQARKADLVKLRGEVEKAFDRDMLIEMGNGAGPAAQTYVPNGQTLNVLRVAVLPKTAPWHVVNYVKEIATAVRKATTVSAQWPGLPNCDCYWGCSINFACADGPAVCNWTSWGCGWFFTEPCGGLCQGPLVCGSCGKEG